MSTTGTLKGNSALEYHRMDSSNWQCVGSLNWEITSIFHLTKALLKAKKVYVSYYLLRNHKVESNQLTCSYSLNQSNTSYRSKDPNRSKILLKDILITEDLLMKIEIFMKQTFSKKILSSIEFPLFDLLKLGNGSVFTNHQFSFPDGVKYEMNFEVIPNSNSQLPGQVSKFFESPLQIQNSPNLNGNHHSESKEEADDRGHQILTTEKPKRTSTNEATKHDKKIPTHQLLNGKHHVSTVASHPSVSESPTEVVKPHTEKASQSSEKLIEVRKEVQIQKEKPNLFEKIKIVQDQPPLDSFTTPERPPNGERENGRSPASTPAPDLRSKSPASDCNSVNSDHLYAVASTGSRVNKNLIKQLSDTRLLLDDSAIPSETGSSSGEGFATCQPTALNWLEKQYAEDTPTKEFLSSSETSPPGKSPVTLPDSSNDYQETKKGRSTIYLPTHSTILEEGSRDDVQMTADQNDSSHEDESPLLNTRPRKFLSKFSKSISSLTEDDEDENFQNSQNLSPSTRSKMRRRTSISTTAPRAAFDGDGEGNEEKAENERIMSGKFIVPVTIDEYDENFFEREGEESPHASFERSQSGEHSVMSQYSVVHSVTDNLNWKKKSGAGIRKARRNKRATPTKRGRATLSTTKHVQNWDQTASAAEVARVAMEERIRDDGIDEDLLEAGSVAGLEAWTVDRGALRKLEQHDIGLFYTSDCYLILSTTEVAPNKLTWALHTWIGSQAERDKCAIAAFKAQRLSKQLGGTHITTNLECDETNEFIEVMFGNITILEGSIAESNLKKSAYQVHDHFSDSPIRLLLVSGGQTASLFPTLGDRPKAILQAIPLQRESFKSSSALILDTGEDLIYQWRGGLVTQVARARLFEAAFSLRSERIKLQPKCRIEVIDEGQEPEEFWQLVDKFSVDQREDLDESERYSSSECDEDYNEDGYESDTDDSQRMNLQSGDEEVEEGSHKSANTESSGVYYDVEDIREYCADQMDGHAEMHRRQIICQSRILDPQAFNLKDSSLEIEGIAQNIINLYRIGYVDGHLHTSRLSGVNSEGVDFGYPKKSQLESKGVYLLDFKDEVYVWIGKESDSDLRVAAMTIAKALLQHSKAEWVRAVRVTEGNEPMLFKTKFVGWHEADMQENSLRLRWNRLSISQHKSSGIEKPMREILNESVNYMKHKRKRKTMLASKHRIIVRSKIAALERHAFHDVLAEDDGRGIAVVWKVVDSELRSLPKSEVGHFWSHEAYVILYGFTPKVVVDDEASNQDAPHFVIYFWQGPHTHEKAYTQWKLCILPQKKDEWIAQMGQIPPEIRVIQGREPLHFFKMFKHRYIVHFAFLNLIRQRNKAEERVRSVQSEILKLEKLRLNNLPVPRRSYRRVSGTYSSPSSRQLLNVARSSPKTPPPGRGSPLHRDGSFSSVDSSVADDISSHTAPVGKSLFQMETSAGVLLFQVRGSGLIDEDVHAVQIEARATRLNSSDCYVAIRPSTRGQSFVWLWVGRGTQYFEQEAAAALAMMILRWVDKEAKGNQVRVVEEGAGEWFDRWIVKSFYRALGGYTQYTNFDLLQTPRYLRPYALRYPQLFICECVRDEYTVTMLERYCQSDLVENVAAILDAHYALFVWYGRVCSAAIKVTSMKVAKKFLGSLKKGSKRLERPVVEVLQDQEPAPFVSCFHGWCDWKLIEKPYIDPRRVRMEVRRSMGLLGDMAPLIGKPIEGLTLAQAEVLSSEYKKQQAKIKKKEAAKTPEKDSIRTRLRKAKKELLDKKNPAPPPKEVIADASYRLPHCVPPPPHILKAMEEYAMAWEIAEEYPQLASESDDRTGGGSKLEITESGHVFPISLSEIRGNKLTPILERQSSNQSIQETGTENDPQPPSEPAVAVAQPKAPPSRSLSRNPSHPYSPSPSTRSIGTPKNSPMTPRTPTEPSQSKHSTPRRPSETTASRLRREKSKSNATTNNSPGGSGLAFGFTKSSALVQTSIPNSPAEPLQKSERKPYIDYLRQKPTHSPASGSASVSSAPAHKTTPSSHRQSVSSSASASGAVSGTAEKKAKEKRISLK